MKFILIAICMLSALFMVYAAAVPNENENPLTIKSVLLTCKSENQAILCRSSVRKVSGPFKQDKFFNAGFAGILYKNQTTSLFTGSCGKVDGLLRAIENCGLKECPDVDCTA